MLVDSRWWGAVVVGVWRGGGGDDTIERRWQGGAFFLSQSGPEGHRCPEQRHNQPHHVAKAPSFHQLPDFLLLLTLRFRLLSHQHTAFSIHTSLRHRNECRIDPIHREFRKRRNAHNGQCRKSVGSPIRRIRDVRIISYVAQAQARY